MEAPSTILAARADAAAATAGSTGVGMILLFFGGGAVAGAVAGALVGVGEAPGKAFSTAALRGPNNPFIREDSVARAISCSPSCLH